MGDFALDTEVHGGDGHYRARLSSDWEIWGPCGGYIAAVALRAAGAHSQFDRPASLHCQFLGVASFDDVELQTETLRGARRSESVHVSMRQNNKPVCDAVVWTVGDADGWHHDWTAAPDVPPPDQVPTIQEQVPDFEAWYPFWHNVEYRPLDWLREEEFRARRPLEPRYRAWFRYLPTARFDDPFVEAGRVALLGDIAGWPAAHRAIPAADDSRFIAPNLDLSVVFHQPPAASDYLFLDGEAPLATGGLIGARGTVWADDGRLLATAIQQMMTRPAPATPA